MAHWDYERDLRWVHMMRETALSKSHEGAECIREFEESGDIIYWSKFIDLIRAEHKDKPNNTFADCEPSQ